MKQETFFFGGDRAKPLVIFIHGMGMDANMWVEPVTARVMGGKYPLSVLIEGKELQSSFHDLRAKGYPVLTWSQRRPAGPVGVSVDELSEIIENYNSNSDAGIILVGHSRGGLIARLFIQEYNAPIRGIITIGTPHNGSSMAKWAVFVSPITAALKSLMDRNDKEVKSAMHRLLTFLSGSEIKEMLPGSQLLKSLADKCKPGVRIVSIGGTNPALVKIGKTSLPSVLSGIIPENVLPEELQEGKGDGFVSARSAVYPCGDEHQNFYAHHAALIFDKHVRKYIVRVIESIKT
ncbi:MAG: lipase family alpha/beta hydrolase [Dissulfurispiraceae bacterium]